MPQAKTKAKKGLTVQMYEDSWYLDKFTEHECCLCGAQHSVEYAVEKGRILTRWKLDMKATAANRKAAGIKIVHTGRHQKVTGATDE